MNLTANPRLIECVDELMQDNGSSEDEEEELEEYYDPEDSIFGRDFDSSDETEIHQ